MSRKLTTSLKHEHFAKITIPGGRSFPIDMLRYDRAMPWKEADSGILERSVDPCVRADFQTWLLVLQYGDAAKPRWAIDRWASFGVTCEPITHSMAETMNAHRDR